VRSGTSGISAEKNAPRELRGAGGQCAQHQRFAPQARDLPMGRVLVPRHGSIKKSFLSFFWIVLCHISILISLLVQWLTESRFGKVKFGIPIEKRSLMSAGPPSSLNSPNSDIGLFYAESGLFDGKNLDF
jgi:hypothetical protein